MLFDLKGKRRRLVQGTYLMLAILLGGGLVLFGIGSSTNGGLGDLFKGGNGSNNGNEVVHKRIDAAEKLLQVNPRNEAALAQVIRGRYQLATADSNPNTGAFGSDGRKQLLLASNTWDRYMSVAKKPDPSLAGVMVQGYTGLALGEGQGAARAHWLKASQAAQLLAAAQPSPAAYIRLVQFATLAGQKRTADLAGRKALQLAPKSQQNAVKQQLDQAKSVAGSQPTTGGGAGGTTTSP